MAAVSAFVARRPAPRQAVRFGVQWAVGHGLSLLLLGSILFALKATIAESLAGSLEKIIGVALVGLGLWTPAPTASGRDAPHALALALR